MLPLARQSDYQRNRKAADSETKTAKQREQDKLVKEVVAEGVGLDDLEFVPTGLLVRNAKTAKDNEAGNDGWLLLLDKFAWVEKAAVDQLR